MAHKWATWRHNPCRLGAPQPFRAGDKNQKSPDQADAAEACRAHPQVGADCARDLRVDPRVAPKSGGTAWCGPETRGSDPTSGTARAPGGDHAWRTIRGLGGYMDLVAWGVPNASKRGTRSEVAHKWAGRRHNPCRLGAPQPFRAGDKLRSRPKVGSVATWTLPLGGSLTLQRGGQNQRWPTSGLDGDITPAAWGVPNASKRGTKSEVAHKWAGWRHNPCRWGAPQPFRAGDKIRSRPQVGPVAT